MESTRAFARPQRSNVPRLLQRSVLRGAAARRRMTRQTTWHKMPAPLSLHWLLLSWTYKGSGRYCVSECVCVSERE